MKSNPLRVIRSFDDRKSNVPSERGFSRADCEWYSRVPKDIRENLEFRKKLLYDCQHDLDIKAEIWTACKRDPLFWINTFCFTFDPRLPKGLQTIPFITFECQDELIYEIYQALGYYDVLIEKSRDMGVSWCSLAAMTHEFQFEHDQQFAIASRKADLVDKNGSKDCLFWKVEALIKGQPGWLRPTPAYEHNQMIMMNPECDSLIIGETATGDIGRAGRNRAVFLDEFPVFNRDDGYSIMAATTSNTQCRIFNGTPNGTGSAFFDIRQGLESGEQAGKLIRLHWSEDLRKNFGLYTNADGYKKFYPGAMDHDKYDESSLIFLDKTPTGKVSDEYDFPADYKFVLDGQLRSPWYDYECKRYAHPMLRAQELDIDYHNSSFRFFDEAEILNILGTQIVEPFRKGNFIFEDETGKYVKFEDNPEGAWLLWLNLDHKDRVAPDLEVVVGVDISSGTGASNSAMSVVNSKTGEKVAEYANPLIMPEAFGRLAAHTFKLFNEAYFIWENNGPGRNFGKTLLENGCTKFYHRRDDVSIHKKVSNIPGWASTPERKYALLSEYRDAQHRGHFTNPSYQAVKECREYINLPNNEVVHQASRDTIDPTGAKKGHGDRVMADALAYKGVQEYGNWESSNSDLPDERFIPEGTFAHRFNEAVKDMNTSRDIWEDDDTGDWAV